MGPDQFEENYGYVLRDCSNALNLNIKSSKAYYRSAVALLALDRPEESLDCCDRCLMYDPDNEGVRSVRDRALKVKAEKSRQDSEKKERILKEQREKTLLRNAFKVHSILVRRRSSDHASGTKSVRCL